MSNSYTSSQSQSASVLPAPMLPAASAYYADDEAYGQGKMLLGADSNNMPHPGTVESRDDNPVSESIETKGESTSGSDADQHDAISPDDRVRAKKQRKRRTVAAGLVGGAVGLVLLGPLGAVAGGVGSAVVTKRVGKKKERRMQQEYETRMGAGPIVTAVGITA